MIIRFGFQKAVLVFSALPLTIHKIQITIAKPLPVRHCRRTVHYPYSFSVPSEVRTVVLIPSAMALGRIIYGTLPSHNHCLPKHRYVDILKRTTAASINTISRPTDPKQGHYTGCRGVPCNIHCIRIGWFYTKRFGDLCDPSCPSGRTSTECSTRSESIGKDRSWVLIAPIGGARVYFGTAD
jgi:hypothetical protein